MRRAALPCRRHRRGLLLVPCVAGLLAAFVVTPSPAAQKTAPSQQPKLWALGVSAGKVPSVKVAKLQWLRRRGIQALVVNASALSPKRLARLTDRAAHSGMLVIAARGSLRPGACPGSSSTLRTCAVIAQTPRKAVRLTRLNSFDYVVYYVHDLRQVNYLRGVKATHTQLLAIVPPALVRADTRRWKSVAANASSDSALNLTIRTAPAASPPVMGLLNLLKRWRPRLVPPRKSPAPAPPPVTNAATTTPVTTDPPPTTTTPADDHDPAAHDHDSPADDHDPAAHHHDSPADDHDPAAHDHDPPPTTTTPPPTTTTPPPTTTTGDTQPPSAPQGLAVTGSSQTSISVSWNASTDDVGVSGYDLYRNGTSIGTTSATSRTFSSLTCGTSYTLGVDAFDAAGNKSAASTISASTAACPDTQAPTAPTGLTVTGSTTTSLSISWSASFDNVSVTGYDVYKGSTVAGTTSTFTSYTVSGLTCGTSYTLAVDAFDAAGNKSTKTSLTTSTAACADTQAPTTPTGLTVTGSTTTSVSVSWSASFDNVAVAGYDVYNGSTVAGTTSTFTSYTVSGLTCGTSYTLAVDAYDAAGNKSTKTSLTTSTAACPAAPASGSCFASPGSCGYPDPAFHNVGVPQGTTLTTSGSLTVTTNGAVINGVNITNGSITVNADNVTIENSRIDCNCEASRGFAIMEPNGHSGLTVKDSEVSDGNIYAGGGMGGTNYFTRLYMHDCDECIQYDANITDSYFLVDGQGAGGHFEATYNNHGTESVQHATILNPHEQTATIFMDVDNHAACDTHLTVNNSLLAGGGAVIYPCAEASSAGSSQVTITNNRFARCTTKPVVNAASGYICQGHGSTVGDGTVLAVPDGNGYYPNGGFFMLDSAIYCGSTTWTNNVWDDNGAAAPC